MAKPFLTWLALSIGIYAGVAGGLHAYFAGHPKRVLVAIDSSFGMKAKWPQVEQTLQEIATAPRYTQFALITEKNRVHGWQEALNLGTTLTYGPRNFARLQGNGVYEEILQADERILVTNEPAAADELERSGWTVRTL